MTVLGIIVFAIYIQHPKQFFLFILLIMIVFLLFYLWYGPKRQRRKNADKIVRTKGEYRLMITDTFIRFGEEQTTWMWKDLKVTFYISENMYTLKADRQIFSIPKRILSEQEEDELIRIMRRQKAQILNIQIKKE